jgi:hypothetical protein
MKKRWWVVLCALLIGFAIASPTGGQAQDDGFVIVGADMIGYLDTSTYTGPIPEDDRFIFDYLDWNTIYSLTNVPAELIPLLLQVGDRFIFQYLDWNTTYSFTAAPPDLILLLQQAGDRFVFQYLDWHTTYSITNTPAELDTLLGQVVERYRFQYLDTNKFLAAKISSDLLLLAQQTDCMPGAFNKLSPPNGATNQPISLTLDWEESTRHYYEYCIDTTPGDICETSWVSTGNISSANISDLSNGTTYYWQVRASNYYGTTYADAGDWWSFTTVSLAPDPFEKIKPQDGAQNQKTRLPLEWEVSEGAVSYEYCIDKVLNQGCPSPAEWINVGNVTSITVSRLKMGTTYEWQVRALSSSGGITYADSMVGYETGVWWEFTTKPKPTHTKISPENGAMDQPTNMLLEWEEDETAISYEYCLDAIDDGVYSTTWVSTGLETSVYLRELASNTTYYWQVRAVTESGYIYADDLETDFWAFTTGETSMLVVLLPFLVR